jgi:hypothetical protein
MIILNPTIHWLRNALLQCEIARFLSLEETRQSISFFASITE